MNAQVDLSHQGDTKVNNMDLWQLVFCTDPLAVKPITGKSYKGNSPKPYWIVEQATKHFGPCGTGWGVEVLDEKYVNCGAEDVIHSAVVKVWYVWNGVRGEIQQVGGTKVAYRTSSNKYYVDEDAAKKSITDGMIKCLSMIGFAGDIFSGRWDDSKYVEQAAIFHQNLNNQSAVQEKNATEAECKQGLNDIKNAQSKADLDKPYNYFVGTQFENQITTACQAKCDQMGWQ